MISLEISCEHILLNLSEGIKYSETHAGTILMVFKRKNYPPPPSPKKKNLQRISRIEIEKKKRVVPFTGSLHGSGEELLLLGVHTVGRRRRKSGGLINLNHEQNLIFRLSVGCTNQRCGRRDEQTLEERPWPFHSMAKVQPNDKSIFEKQFHLPSLLFYK